VVTDEQVAGILNSSEQIHQKLWSVVSEIERDAKDDPVLAGHNISFKDSVLALSDIHYTRVHAGIINRIPFTIWITLYLMAVLAMVIMGYQAGLTDRRSPVATITLAVAFTAVIILIADLDRPVMTFFEVNTQLLDELYEDMAADTNLEFYRGE